MILYLKLQKQNMSAAKKTKKDGGQGFVQTVLTEIDRKEKIMTLFEYGKSVLEAWDDFIETLLYSSPIGKLAKKVVERSKQ